MADDKISSSKKEIYTKLLNIAGKYTDIENNDFLKTGLFGYITESMAMMMRDSTFHKSMIYNESMLNTAIIPKTVYNWAKTFNIEVQNATPAYADIEIIIPINSLEVYINKYKLDSKKFSLSSEYNADNKNFLILDKEDPILAGEYYFSLEHSILIEKKTNSSSKIYYQARYLTSSEEYQSTSFQTIRSKKLDVRNNYIYNDETNIIIKARAYQYKKTVFTRQISTNSFLNKIQRFEFEDQFCGAKLFYKENGIDNELDLTYNDIVTNAAHSAFYNLNNSNELEIKFRSGPNYFTPAANTVLKVIIYSTKGKTVPNTFKGDALILFSKSDMKSLPVIIHFNPTDIIGGKDSPTIEEIKQTIINEISTRKTISTKADLNTYFDILTMLVQSINSGKVTFTKKRDDIIKRIYNSYLLIRDMTDDSTTDNESSSTALSSCVPTNTIDVMLKSDNDAFTTTANGTVEFKYPAFKFNIENQQYENENINNITENDDYYICPFTIFISSTPIRYIKYVYNLTDSSTTLSYNDDKEYETTDFQDEHYMTPTSISLNRGFADSGFTAEDDYILTLTFSTDFALGSCDDSTKTVLSPSGAIIINDVLDIEVKPENCRSIVVDESTFTTTIKLSLPVDIDEFDFDSNQASKIKIKGNLFNSSNLIDLNFDYFKIDNQKVGGYYISDEKLIFFQQLDDIMDSSLITIPLDANGKEINKKETTPIASYNVGIKEVPVVHSSFFSDDDTTTRKSGFITQLFTYINILKENNAKLETSTFFNLKFYNTYGPSHFYDTINTNLDLKMNISLDKSYATDYDNLKTEIKSYIRKIIDKMNEKQQFSISSIISLLLDSNTYGKYITYIQFIGLNDSFNQVITKNETVDEADYPPEWLNIQPKALNNITFEDISRSNI